MDGQRILRDICRWHVEEFAYLVAKLKSTPEGDGNLLDHTCLVYVHEHAEANPHKNDGLAMIVVGHAGKLATGIHSKVTGTVGDLYLALADGAMQAGLGKFPTASKPLSVVLA
jgi:4-hydroxy-3-methylbut-2-enyl diphosphate reductase IspH